METLNGARIALLEGRMRGELAELVRRHGGLPCSVPAVEEAPLASSERVTVLLDQLTGGAVTVAVLLTGTGVRSLFAEAERLGRPEELRVALRTATTVCRGPKPVGALSQEGVPARVKAPAPHTTAKLLGAMAPLDLHGAGVVVVHYGERNGPLVEALCARGARLEELCLYEWRLPADRGPLRALVRRLIDGDLDAIAFTSQVQLRHLLTVAGEMGQEEALLDALRSTRSARRSPWHRSGRHARPHCVAPESSRTWSRSMARWGTWSPHSHGASHTTRWSQASSGQASRSGRAEHCLPRRPWASATGHATMPWICGPALRTVRRNGRPALRHGDVQIRELLGIHR